MSKEFYSIRFLFNLPLKDNYWNLSDSLNIIFFMFYISWLIYNTVKFSKTFLFVFINFHVFT